MVRGLILGSLAFAGVYLASKQLHILQKDIAKYDQMSTMSGSPTLAQKAITSLLNVFGQPLVSRERQTRDFIENVVGDVIRYARIKGM